MDDAWGTPSTPISGNLQMTQRAILLGFCWGRPLIPTKVGYGKKTNTYYLHHGWFDTPKSSHDDGILDIISGSEYPQIYTWYIHISNKF